MIKTVCAWCGTTMQEGEEPVSHGICPSCEDQVERDEERREQDEAEAMMAEQHHDYDLLTR